MSKEGNKSKSRLEADKASEVIKKHIEDEDNLKEFEEDLLAPGECR